MTQTLTFRNGLKDALPIAFGYFCVSFAFGMTAAGNGLPHWMPALMSLTNLSGTGQLAGLNLMAAGATLLQILITTLTVNARYFLMSVSLSQRLPQSVTLWQRLVIAFGNTDEIYAVSMSKSDPLNLRYMLGLIVCAAAGWVAGSEAGVLANGIVSASVMSVLKISLYAMFVAIIVPPATKEKPVAIVILLSAALSCVLRCIPLFDGQAGGWAVILCGVFASLFGAYAYPAERRDAYDK